MKWFFLKIINKIKERKFIKYIEICILYAGILFLFLLFQNEILAAFDKTVLPFCENTTNTPYTKVSFIIIVGLCLVLCVRLLATGYRISRKVILPYIIITLIYIYCRIICGYVFHRAAWQRPAALPLGCHRQDCRPERQHQRLELDPCRYQPYGH